MKDEELNICWINAPLQRRNIQISVVWLEDGLGTNTNQKRTKALTPHDLKIILRFEFRINFH